MKDANTYGTIDQSAYYAYLLPYQRSPPQCCHWYIIHSQRIGTQKGQIFDVFSSCSISILAHSAVNNNAPPCDIQGILQPLFAHLHVCDN